MELKRFFFAARSTGMCPGARIAEGDDGSTANWKSNRLIQAWGLGRRIGECSIYLERDGEGVGSRELIVHILEDTAVVDAVTGEMRGYDDLQEGERLYAYVSPLMTRSRPPQASAELVLCNIPDGVAPPTYVQVHSVRQESGGLDVLVSGGVRLHLNQDTELFGWKGKRGIKWTDIRPERMLLAWYDVVTLSLPAQAAPRKVLVFPGG